MGVSVVGGVTVVSVSVVGGVTVEGVSVVGGVTVEGVSVVACQTQCISIAAAPGVPVAPTCRLNFGHNTI